MRQRLKGFRLTVLLLTTDDHSLRVHIVVSMHILLYILHISKK